MSQKIIVPVGQTVTFLGTKEVEMSIRRTVGAALKLFTTLYEGEEINSMILSKGGKTLLRLIRRWVEYFVRDRKTTRLET
jgi:hypothetical protein